MHGKFPDGESYDERMGFIFALLRARQCDPALFALPARGTGGTDRVRRPGRLRRLVELRQ